MIRQSSSRNQRSKGTMMKHILQICMLLAVCFWLIYQVKHSHDKRKHFEETEAELPERLPNHEVLKLGRKDLHPHDEELSTNHEKIDDEELEDEETVDKGDDTFNETQEELERKRKEEGAADIDALIRGEEGAGGRGGDDDIDEQELEIGEREADGDEDVIGDNEVEKVIENEKEEKDGEVDEHQPDIDTSSDDLDGSGMNTHEAQEEHYKADDASSAAAHVAQTGLNEISERNNLISDLDVHEHGGSSNETVVGKGDHLNTENDLEESNEATPPKFEDVPFQNDVSGGIVDSTLQNNTKEGLSDEKGSNTTYLTDHNPTSSNTTTDAIVGVDDTSSNTTTDAIVGVDENSNSTTNQDFSTTDLVMGSNRTTNTNETSSFTTDENEEVTRDRIDTEEDSVLSFLNDDETLRDPLISEEEDNLRENSIDLDTLPEIQTEGTDSDDAAT